MRRSSAHFSTQLEGEERETFCTALRTIHDTFEAKRKRMIEQGKLPTVPHKLRKEATADEYDPSLHGLHPRV